MAEVDSPKPVNITEDESSPPITGMEGFLQIVLVLEIGVEEVEGWREKYSIPSRIAIRIPGPFDITSDFQSEEIPVYEGFFESGFRDWVSLLAEKVSEMLEISPGQLNPPSWRTMIAIQNLGDFKNLALGVDEVQYS